MSGTTTAWKWHHTGFSVREIDSVINYYGKSLGFEVIFEARNMSDLISSITGVQGLGAHLVQMKSKISDQVLEFIEFTNVPKIVDDILPIYPGRAHTAYLVKDLETAVESMKREGGILLGRITEFSEGKAAYCADRFGTVVELEEWIQTP